MGEMKPQQEGLWSSLPDDVALKIASNLQVGDVCNLGSCSRFWRGLCDSAFLWESLARERWPLLSGLGEGSSSSSSSVAGGVERTELDEITDRKSLRSLFLMILEHELPFLHLENLLQGWKCFYIKWHAEMSQRAVAVAQFIDQCSSNVSIEIRDYLKAIEDLNSMQLGFTDIQMFFFRPSVSVLLNLVGLHYCISWLGVPAEDVMEALEHHKISQRQVCVKWWKVGRWFYGFRMRDESHSRQVSLQDLTISQEKKNEVLGVLFRGAIHEVVRVQISVATPTSTSWSHQLS